MVNYNELSRPLDISEVDFRVQSINNGGYATILAYKDARVDMNRLDEVLTHLGWQRDYKLINNRLFCGVGIWHSESGQWIWKWDVGTESNTEAEKGQASDAFKRACFNLGIGRELYDYPVISVKLLDHEWTKDGGKPRQTFNLKIKDWKWYSEFTDGKISFLAAKDENGNVRFRWGAMKPKDKGEEPSYKPASGGEPTPDETRPEPPTSVIPQERVVEEGNPAGLLKKKDDPIQPDDVDLERMALIKEYTDLYGKAPHGRSSNDRIKQDIEEFKHKAMSEQLKEEEEPLVDEAHEEDIPTMPQPEEEEELEVEEIEGTILDLIDEIQEFVDPAKFVAWAKDAVSEWSDKDTEDNVATFKKLCNDHYSKIAPKN